MKFGHVSYLNRVGLVAFFSLSLVLMSGIASATTAIIPSDDELIIGSRAIVEGRVLGISTQYDEVGGLVFTYITLQINEVFKGTIDSERIVIKQLGGIAGEHGTMLYGTPEFAMNERAVLFLDTSRDGSLRVHHWFLGKFDISEIGNTGIVNVNRSSAGENVSILGRSTAGNVTDRLRLDEFEDMIREGVIRNRRSSQLMERRYYSRVPLLAFPADYIRVAEREVIAVPSFTFLTPASPARWFEPDTGKTVSFVINTSVGAAGPLPANDSPAQILADALSAMSALSSVSGSSLRLIGSSSTTGGCGIQTGDGNAISFNNCDGFFSPGGGCSGILAVGGVPSYTLSNPVVINGTSFYKTVEGDVTFNPYASCYFTDRCRVQEVMTHELGHAIGLGHSADPTATMSPAAHFDGRCASLAADDIAGIRALYPAIGN
ncbi:MAG: matrixin family metalloprotease [Acidobacteriota bacterium]